MNLSEQNTEMNQNFSGDSSLFSLVDNPENIDKELFSRKNIIFIIKIIKLFLYKIIIIYRYIIK
jgi:hypothetical protein